VSTWNRGITPILIPLPVCDKFLFMKEFMETDCGWFYAKFCENRSVFLKWLRWRTQFICKLLFSSETKLQVWLFYKILIWRRRCHRTLDASQTLKMTSINTLRTLDALTCINILFRPVTDNFTMTIDCELLRTVLQKQKLGRAFYITRRKY